MLNVVLMSFLLFPSSGLMHEGHARDVEQVYLRCSQGSLEWLYPTGAIIVNLRPNTVSPSAARLSVCIKPSAESRGANIYLDRSGKLRLLMREEEQARGKVRCFGLREGALFIEAVPHMDISRRSTAFQYELLGNRPGPDARSLGGKTRLWFRGIFSREAAVNCCVRVNFVSVFRPLGLCWFIVLPVVGAVDQTQHPGVILNRWKLAEFPRTLACYPEESATATGGAIALLAR